MCQSSNHMAHVGQERLDHPTLIEMATVDQSATEREHTDMASPLDHFDRIVCINLDERPDRWQQMQDTLGPLLGRVKLERFSAVKPDVAQERVYNGRAGCLLSHRRVIEAAFNDGLQNVLVLEDDVCFDPDFLAQAQRALATLEATPWDLFYLGFTPKAPLVPAGDALLRTFGGSTTHAIAYHRRAMPDLLRWLPEENDVLRFLSRYKSVDRYYWQALATRLRCYAAAPPVAFQRDGFSDIQQGQTPCNEQQAKQAFDEYMTKPLTPMTKLGLHVRVRLRRLGYTVDSLRRSMFRRIKAK